MRALSLYASVMIAIHKDKSLASLLRRYKMIAIAADVHVDMATVRRWYRGHSLPRPEKYRALAGFLRMSIEELADLIAEDSKRMALARVSEVA